MWFFFSQYFQAKRHNFEGKSKLIYFTENESTDASNKTGTQLNFDRRRKFFVVENRSYHGIHTRKINTRRLNILRSLYIDDHHGKDFDTAYKCKNPRSYIAEVHKRENAESPLNNALILGESNFTKTMRDSHFFGPAMTLEELLVMTDLLKVLTENFEENEIPYFIYKGTLLGSYRHHSTIPWDDDVDITFHSKSMDKVKHILQVRVSPPRKEVHLQKETRSIQRTQTPPCL